ncbi:choice-of-anchor D domain-containing protein [Methylomicrobium lacus]|uniref:choice-of-anchor D domain-containing protein n=1 Tax=Methylomicrobium lacus TaxID=136992 RepID=UPI0035A867E1
MAVLITMTNVGVEPSQAAINTSSVGSGFTVTAADLAFILQQIKIAEFHAANATPTNLCGALVGSGPNQIPDPLLSFGLRTVDGSCNNLQKGQETFGASDQVFPRLTTPNFNRSTEGIAADFFGPGSPAIPPSTYAVTSGAVADSLPRIISNLVVDQTSTNPAAVFVAGNPARTQGDTGVVPCDASGLPAGCVPQFQTLFIPNVTTDVGLSPPFNSLFTIFGQFFDHGLDKITNGGNGTVFVPLKDDDPLVAGPDHIFGTVDDLAPQLRFMVLTRGTIKNDPITGIRSAPNTDTPFVDQSQTYTSHSSHQVFLREYDNTSGKPLATGKFLSEANGGMATWASVKTQAATKLGLQLSDADVTNIPMIAADQYGNFIPGPARGMPQYVTTGGTGLVEGNPAIPVPVPADVVRIETAFLNDIAHSAAPTFDPNNPGILFPDSDTVVGSSLATTSPPGSYDDELLNLHFICGDGRCNENIALTAVHQIFHMEHDRLIDYFMNPTDGVLTRPENAALLADYQNVTPTADNPKPFTFQERLFQAARFATEMQYQHLVFEEFARKVQPAINPFQPFAFNQTDLNSAITAEYAHAVYRFGHSMLTDTIPRINADGSHNDIALLAGFLNPAAFYQGGSAGTLDSRQATGSIIMGLSDQTGNEIDEFVADTLRNNLLGLPLDLPSINMARARSEGIPPLNNVRKQIFAKTNDGQLRPYTNWIDFDQNIKHHVSLVNFIAAYGKHPSITTLDPDGAGPILAGSLQARRMAADQIVNGTTLPGPNGILGDGDDILPPGDSGAFMFSTGAWANDANGVSTTGVDDIDLWVGGLAENTNLFGGLLGPTFNYVFEKQLTDLQNGDRMYYLARTPGMNLRTQLEGNSFAELVMRNTNPYTHTLKADPFATADCKFELANLHTPYVPGTDPLPISSTLVPPLAAITGPGSVNDDPLSECDENQLLLFQADGTIQYRAINNIDPAGINGQSVYNGTDFADQFYGGNDNDTFWGGLGDDRIEVGGGDDVALGGDGDDIITDFGGADILKGGPGNDAIDGGIGDDIIIPGSGKDFTNGGANINETFAGPDDDFAIAGQGEDAIFGDSGDEWEEGGDQPDLLIGDSSSIFFDDHNLPGHDILIGQGGDDDYDMEGGDDIGVSGPGVEKVAGAAGYDWEIGLGDPQPQDMDLAIPLLGLPLPVNVARDKFNEVEAMSGWKFNDILHGDSIIPSQVNGGGFIGCDALDANGVARIKGLDALVPAAIRTIPSAPIVAASASFNCQLTGLVWGEGNIILGGEGSDTLEGRGADDILDGDRYLNVRLSVRNGTDDANGVDTVRNGSGPEIGSTDLMENAAVTGDFGPLATGMTLQQAVFAGKVNPGNIVIVREILLPTVPVADCGATTPLNCDTAWFSGPAANYIIIGNADGSVTVRDNTGVDGTDTLRNIEQLSFCTTPGAVKGTCDVRAAPVSVASTIAPVASISPASLALTFGNQVVNTTSLAQSITVSNTGNSNLVVSGITLTGVDPGQFLLANTINCATVAPLGSCTFNVQFAPTTTGTKTASVSIASNAAGSPASVAVSGTGLAPAPIVAIAPVSLAVAFPDQVINTTSAAQTITVSNTGTANLTVSGVTLSGATTQFSFTNNCTTAVVPGGSCTVSVQFRPTSTGAKTATVSIASNAAGSPSSVTVSGNGIVAATTATIANATIGGGGGVRIGTSATGNVRVTNTGTNPLIITSASTTAPFSVTLGTCTTPVNPGRTCNLSVTFRPTAVQTYTATLTMASNASNNPSGTLTGRGR